MSGYRELKEQADELMRRAEEVRLAELEAILLEVRTRVAEYGLTPKQIFGRRTAVRRSVTVVPKYRDPDTGVTWSGRGREPAWIRGKRRERFLIDRQDD